MESQYCMTSIWVWFVQHGNGVYVSVCQCDCNKSVVCTSKLVNLSLQFSRISTETTINGVTLWDLS